MSKNLISIKQLRQEEISGYALAVTSGYVAAYVTNASGTLQSQIDESYSYATEISGLLTSVSGNLYTLITGLTLPEFTGLRIPISAGVDTVHCSYGAEFAKQIFVGTLGCSGVSDPIINSMVTSTSSTGNVVTLSSTTPSSNYYLNLLVQF